MAVTPAGAEVSQAMATNWKKIWKKNLKPLADKRYYTKAQSDTKFATKAESAASAAAAQAGATSAANAATDSKLSGYYKKAESDAKYAPTPTVVRGVFAIRQTSVAGGLLGTPISYGITLTSAPTVHMIDVGDPVPVGCSGSSVAPSASPGHLCVFVETNTNGGSPFINNAGGFAGSSTFGAYIGSSAPAAGGSYLYGGWALGVSSLSGARVAPGADSAGSADGR